MPQYGAFQRGCGMATSGDMSGIKGGFTVVFLSARIFCQFSGHKGRLDDLAERSSI
ncbi:hypothetical protein HNQ50_001609 [Silvimonas terrae]|uniref:Uncharacterized protein n=1 Tax=Silvimonas terrae TaxID=300266 RepID=A0A840REQ2_9NEIS|nr:hypothetical protein [Silvimonas terrae]MBB5190886.1 hypothetical protein [Silvimonas terrae]